MIARIVRRLSKFRRKFSSMSPLSTLCPCPSTSGPRLICDNPRRCSKALPCSSLVTSPCLLLLKSCPFYCVAHRSRFGRRTKNPRPGCKTQAPRSRAACSAQTSLANSAATPTFRTAPCITLRPLLVAWRRRGMRRSAGLPQSLTRTDWGKWGAIRSAITPRPWLHNPTGAAR